MSAADRKILVSCEHGGNGVPAPWRHLFRGRRALLRSHRGWDPGALPAAKSLARALGAPLLAATTTRLLVDPNRSPHNPRVFSELTRGLSRETREALLARHHRPHWDRVRRAIDTAPGATLHLAVHSFTPVLGGRARPYTVGLLYDPKRPGERRLACDWQEALATALGPGAVRRNAPYRGDSDGLTTAMRREHPAGRYLGLELELSQAVATRAAARRALVAKLLAALEALLPR